MAEVSRRVADAPIRPLSRQDALSQMQELARLRNAAPMPNLTDGSEPFNFPPPPQGQQQAQAQQGPQPPTQAADPLSQPPLQPLPVPAQSVLDDATRLHEGLAVYTVGHLLPRSGVDDAQGTWKYDPDALAPGAMALDGAMGVMPNGVQVNGGYVQQPTASRPYDPAREVSDPGPSSAGNALVRPPSTLRVRRQTFVPGWSIPPRVLVVDDDQVNRSLSTKFLQVFGCTIDVAVDGVGAVNKMNLEKYDLVLMDIVMPKLDGVAATSMIRQFDPSTPIISMTSASRPDDIMNYINHGMNDILPKPFSKEGLLEMLEKHLMHLKVIKEKGIPRGLTPGPSGEAFQFMGHAGGIDPLSGLGLDPERYAAILQTMVSNESFAGVPMVDMGGMGVVLEHPMEKRARDDSSDGREPKRPRFEEIE
jgi:osomolarity two-component system response regulator SKN7